MFDLPASRHRRNSLLNRYASQLNRVVERSRAEMALLMAKEDAEKAARLAREAMLEAQAANRAKTEFLANMSHELRTPLNAIIGFSDVMQTNLLGPPDSEKYQEYVRDIHDSGQHLLGLINDILDLAKIEAGKLELDEQVVDVDRVAQSCLTVIKERAQEGGVTVHHELLADKTALYADERKLKQVIINLLSNAVKFTDSGGKVTLATGVNTKGEFFVKVIDTGIGIASEKIWMALTPFRQVDSKLSRNYEGTGLGLPFSKALVELHGGCFDIQSEVGVGTTVTVLFPAHRARRQATAA